MAEALDSWPGIAAQVKTISNPDFPFEDPDSNE
jgi:hypothetical protein